MTMNLAMVLRFAGLAALAAGPLVSGSALAQAAVREQVRSLMPFEASAGRDTAIDEITIPPGGRMPLQGYLEERMYYTLDGRGILSVYDTFPAGDTYVIRPDLSLFTTPGLKHELFNTGPTPLRMVVFRVKGGVAPQGVPDGVTYWPPVSKPGVTVNAPAVGSGFWITYVYDEHSNPSVTEGQRLQVRGLRMRRAQKFNVAELLVLGENGETRLNLSSGNGAKYVISGEGHFVQDGKKIPFHAGSVFSTGPGTIGNTVNTGKYPAVYISIGTTPDQ